MSTKQKYEMVDRLITYMGVGYNMFEVDPETHEVIGLDAKKHKNLVAKWLHSGIIKEMKPKRTTGATRHSSSKTTRSRTKTFVYKESGLIPPETKGDLGDDSGNGGN